MIPKIPGVEFPDDAGRKIEAIFLGSKPGGVLAKYARCPGWQLSPEAEEAIMQILVLFMESYLKKPPQIGATKLRGVHAKPHGIFDLILQVVSNLQSNLQTSFFYPGAEYEGYGRSSNGIPIVGRDLFTGGGLGLGLKFPNVPGEKVLPDEGHTQDFLFLNYPRTFVGDAETYVPFTKAQGAGFAGLMPFFFPSFRPETWRLLELRNFVGTAARVHVGPLNRRLESQTVWQHGEHEVRYALFPRRVPKIGLPPNLWHPNYHRETLVRQLRLGEFVFDFMVQRRLPGENVNNPMIDWKGPFVKIGTLIIPPQEFDTPERNRFGENLSINPGHALLEHRPLGEINCTRMLVYWLSSILRHWLNGVSEKEPQ